MKVDARLGLEPRVTPSEGVVLPLHHQAMAGALRLELKLAVSKTVPRPALAPLIWDPV